jgi:predicted nucleotide-binding protein
VAFFLGCVRAPTLCWTPCKLSSSSVSNPIDRRWIVREALLAWLFQESLKGRHSPILSPEAVAKSGWAGPELSTDEVDRASVWLKEQGFIDGPEVWGGGVVRPSLTAIGELAAEKGDLRARVGAGSSSAGQASTNSEIPAAIFLVHGRDTGSKYEVARWLEQSVSADVVILDEQANRGQTIIEKFQAHADAAKFAVVLLTSDDVGGVHGGDLRPRARQNVIFELGYFYGKLGRERVAVLNDGVEEPSDFLGSGYISFSGNWKDLLGRELRAAGFDLRAN